MGVCVFMRSSGRKYVLMYMDERNLSLQENYKNNPSHLIIHTVINNKKPGNQTD